MGPERRGTTWVVLLGHSGSGKTALARALMAASGNGAERGALGGDPEERRHGMTLNLSLVRLGLDAHLGLLDTPGYPDFAAEAWAAAWMADMALVCAEAGAGDQFGTEVAVHLCRQRGLPHLLVLTQMDRSEVSYERALDVVASQLGMPVVPLGCPQGDRVMDLLAGEGEEEFAWARERLLETLAMGDDSLLEAYLEGRAVPEAVLLTTAQRLVAEGATLFVWPVAAETGLGVTGLLKRLEAFATGPRPRPGVATISPDPSGPPVLQVFKTLADPYVGRLSLFRVLRGTVTPDSHLWNPGRGIEERMGQLFAVEGAHEKPTDRLAAGDIGGVARLQGTVTGDTLTADRTVPALPWVQYEEPTHRMRVEPKGRSDEDRITGALERLVEEDPSLRIERAGGGQLLVAGYGDLHLQVMVERLQRKFGVQAELALPAVAYRETIRRKVKVEGKHKKQTGGHGQYGHVWLEIEPSPQEFEFIDRIVGGVVPAVYRPAVEKGVREAMASGVLGGFPVTGVRVTLVDGSHHPVDSSEIAFKLAAALAFRKGMAQADPILLEPVDEVEVRVPEAFLGDVIADLNRRRAHVLGMEADGAVRIVRAEVPEAELLTYAVDLRSLTQGRGRFVRRPSHLKEVPEAVAQTVLAGRQTQVPNT